MINEEVKKLLESINQRSNTTPELVEAYQNGVIDTAGKIKQALMSKIDALIDELQSDARGSATIEADRDGFNRGISMLGNILKRQI